MTKIIMGTGIVIILLTVILGYGYWCATRLPKNTPEAFITSGNRGQKKVVCIGDSITHGAVSYNYVDELARRHTDSGYSFINAGINSELSHNVLQRIDGIIQCKPDFITILIGSNDVLATLNEKNTDRYIKEMKLPQSPDRPWYEQNLAAIVDILQQKTSAKIALLSLPPITEDSTHPGYQRTVDYSLSIKHLATARGLSYLPLNESMARILETLDEQGESAFIAGDSKQMYIAIFNHYILRTSWEDIAEGNNFTFLTDAIHLNRTGALMVADLIDGFLASSQ